jgi:hypothetical protein
VVSCSLIREGHTGTSVIGDARELGRRGTKVIVEQRGESRHFDAPQSRLNYLTISK